MIQKTHQIGTSHPSHANLIKSRSKWLWLQLDWSHHIVKRCQCPGRRWALSAPRMPTSCRKFSRRLRCAASLDRIKMYQVFWLRQLGKNRPKSNTQWLMFVLDPSNAFLCPWSKHLTCAANAKVMVLAWHACVGYYHLLVHYQIAIASTHSCSSNIPELFRAQSFLIRVHFTRIQDIHDTALIYPAI